jgi:hypothetical protein
MQRIERREKRHTVNITLLMVSQYSMKICVFLKLSTQNSTLNMQKLNFVIDLNAVIDFVLNNNNMSQCHIVNCFIVQYKNL